MVLGWIIAAVVIIAFGSAVAGEFHTNYDTPGSESKERFGGYSSQEIYVVWKDARGATSPEATASVNRFLAEAERVAHIARHTPIRVSDNGQIGATTLPLTITGWTFKKDDSKKLIAAAERNSDDGLDIELGGDAISDA
jgi:putative drug exporter of the RND superfamily